MKKGLWAVMMISAAPFFLQACSSTFVAYKDGHGYFVGSQSDTAYRMFCESGDLKKILAETTKLGQDMKNDLYASNCGDDRSRVKVTQAYKAMTPEQRKDLRIAFKKNGYDINYMNC